MVDHLLNPTEANQKVETEGKTQNQKGNNQKKVHLVQAFSKASLL